MKLATDEDRTSARTLPAIVFEAIVRKRCVAATYNRLNVVLAPHVIFMKNDALHVGAVTITRGGERPREEKMGVFKLDGLGVLTLTEEEFDVRPVFEPEDERWVDSALMKVEA